jgi:hypothetical protein
MVSRANFETASPYTEDKETSPYEQHGDEQRTPHDDPSKVFTESDGTSIASSSQKAKPSSLYGDSIDDIGCKERVVERAISSHKGETASAIVADDDESSMLIDADKMNQIRIPDDVAQALDYFTSEATGKESREVRFDHHLGHDPERNYTGSAAGQVPSDFCREQMHREVHRRHKGACSGI